MPTLADTVRAEVVAALRAADRDTGGERGAQVSAAERLGITRHALRRLRQRYGLRPDGTPATGRVVSPPVERFEEPDALAVLDALGIGWEFSAPHGVFFNEPLSAKLRAEAEASTGLLWAQNTARASAWGDGELGVEFGLAWDVGERPFPEPEVQAYVGRLLQREEVWRALPHLRLGVRTMRTVTRCTCGQEFPREFDEAAEQWVPSAAAEAHAGEPGHTVATTVVPSQLVAVYGVAEKPLRGATTTVRTEVAVDSEGETD